MEIFSFIKHPILHLLEISSDVVSGIEKSVAIYYSEPSKTIQGNVIHSASQSLSADDLFLNDYDLIDKLRLQTTSYSWQTASNLPFETTTDKKVELNIFDEFENVVLCLSFTNEHDHKKDLLFLYLNKNKANFGVASSDVPLSTNEKNIIAQVVYKSFQVIYKQQTNDRNTLISTNKRITGLQSENESLKEEIARLRNENKESKLKVATDALLKISNQYQIKFSIATSAVDKINLYKGDYDILKASIEASAINAINTKFGLVDQHIELIAWDLQFDTFENTKEDLSNKISERYHKTLQLLDKLESAAQVVLDRNKKLTSENVGSACPIPISAPAISDALKNHHKKVRSLLNEYPERWPIIKTEFRPVKNILLSSTA